MTADTASPEALYAGTVTHAAGQHGQEIVLKYARRPATNSDVARMVVLLRRTADELARGLP